MAIQMKCDRCGVEIPPKDSGRIRVISGATELKQMDLCSYDKTELLKKLDEFLRH